MPTLDNISIDYLFSMFKGEPGTRKSTSALSYPTPQYWISTDRKMESLYLPAKRWGVKWKDVQYDDYTSWQGKGGIVNKLEQLQVDCPFQTVVVDSITANGDIINLETKRTKAGTKTKEGTEKGKVVGGISVNSIEDYNAEAGAFQELIALLKDIHKHHRVNVILIAHVVGQRKSDPSNDLTHHSRVIITGGDKISGKISAYCTETYHFNIRRAIDIEKEGEYGLYTVHTGNDYARTCLPLNPHILFNNKPLYKEYIKPAIERAKNEQPITTF